MLYQHEPRRLFGELKEDGERLVVAKGGEGGMGNASLKGGRMTGKASPPQRGARGWFDVELKLVGMEGGVGRRRRDGGKAVEGGEIGGTRFQRHLDQPLSLPPSRPPSFFPSFPP